MGSSAEISRWSDTSAARRGRRGGGSIHRDTTASQEIQRMIRMTTFVLVHGTWGGGWQWRNVAERLRKNGHSVFTPTFTGLGERAHLISRQTNLDTHVQDIAAIISCERLTDVALVGTSYAGLVISGV